MAWRDLPSLISHLSEVAGLLREQIALTRELIRVQTGQPARTLASSSTRRSSGQRQPLRTAKDTFVMTPDRYREQAIEAEKASRRGPSEPMPPAGQPTSEQPLPDQPATTAPPPPSSNPV